jgi:DNA invertase Pin-like site-specific DNA recombinase
MAEKMAELECRERGIPFSRGMGEINLKDRYGKGGLYIIRRQAWNEFKQTYGRKPAMTQSKIQTAKSMYEQGVQIKEIAEVLGVSRPTIYRALEQA